MLSTLHVPSNNFMIIINSAGSIFCCQRHHASVGIPAAVPPCHGGEQPACSQALEEVSTFEVLGGVSGENVEAEPIHQRNSAEEMGPAAKRLG